MNPAPTNSQPIKTSLSSNPPPNPPDQLSQVRNPLDPNVINKKIAPPPAPEKKPVVSLKTGPKFPDPTIAPSTPNVPTLDAPGKKKDKGQGKRSKVGLIIGGIILLFGLGAGLYFGVMRPQDIRRQADWCNPDPAGTNYGSPCEPIGAIDCGADGKETVCTNNTWHATGNCCGETPRPTDPPDVSYCSICSPADSCECIAGFYSGKKCKYAPPECVELGYTWQPDSSCVAGDTCGDDGATGDFTLDISGDCIVADNGTSQGVVVTKNCSICSDTANDGCSDVSSDYLRGCVEGDYNITIPAGAENYQVACKPSGLQMCENYQVDAHTPYEDPTVSNAIVGEHPTQGDACLPTPTTTFTITPVPPTITPVPPTVTPEPLACNSACSLPSFDPNAQECPEGLVCECPSDQVCPTGGGLCVNPICPDAPESANCVCPGSPVLACTYMDSTPTAPELGDTVTLTCSADYYYSPAASPNLHFRFFLYREATPDNIDIINGESVNALSADTADQWEVTSWAASLQSPALTDGGTYFASCQICDSQNYCNPGSITTN